jgi:hypothetical protein
VSAAHARRRLRTRHESVVRALARKPQDALVPVHKHARTPARPHARTPTLLAYGLTVAWREQGVSSPEDGLTAFFKIDPAKRAKRAKPPP